jgi:mevalonate pyrophosphate decarboxylase
MTKETKSKLSRRNFLLAVGAGSTAAVAAVAGRAINADTPRSQATEDKRRGAGYRESAHVRSYYNTAKV